MWATLKSPQAITGFFLSKLTKLTSVSMLFYKGSTNSSTMRPSRSGNNNDKLKSVYIRRVMLENRQIVIITLGYIIGILTGLYCKISIVLLYLLFFIIYFLLKRPHSKKFKLISLKRFFRYVKLIITKKVLFLIIPISIISNTITIYKNYEFRKTIENLSGKEIQAWYRHQRISRKGFRECKEGLSLAR